MSLSTTATRVDYAGDGTTTAFAVPFQFFGPGEIEVIERSALGVETTRALGTDFAVAGGDGLVGTVTATLPVPIGVIWTIRRNTLRTQPLILTPDGGLPAKALEQRLDRQMAVAQEQEELFNRALVVGRSEAPPGILPRDANKVIGYGPARELALYDPPSVAAAGDVAPDGTGATPAAASLWIKRLLDVDVYAFGADPTATDVANLTAITAAIARANAIGGVLKAQLRPGTYSLSGNLPALTSAAGIDMAGSIFSASSAGQTGAFMTIGSLVANGWQSRVVRGVRAVRATIANWTDASQIGVLLSCLQNSDIEIAEVDGFTIGLRGQGAFDGTTAADFVHNRISIGRIWRCKYAVDLFSDSPGLAGAPNNNRLIGGDITAQSGINTSEDRFGLSLRTRTWFSGTFTANATTDVLTLSGGGSIPNGGRVRLSTTGTLPGGLIAGDYFIVGSSGSTVQLSTSFGGSAVNITDAGTGTHSIEARGYRTHNTNLWIGPSFQHARPGSSTFTVNIATDDLIVAGTGVASVGTRVVLSTTGALPGGLAPGSYFVVAATGLTIKVSATEGGSAINITDNGSGVHSISFQGATAYCVLSEVDATQNRITAARAEWTAPSVMRGSLTTGGGGPNVQDIDFATSYLRTELTDVVTGSKAAWRTENRRYSINANDAMRPLLVVPSLRQTMFQDVFGGVVSYGFDDLHATYTTAPPSGDTATIAEVCLRNSQNTATPGQDYITPTADGALVKAPRGIGCLVDTHEVKWLTFLWTQPLGARSGKVMIRQFNAAGVVLLSTEAVLIDQPSFTLGWDATARGWITSAEATDAGQSGRLTFKVAEAAKFCQVALVWGGANFTMQSFGLYTSEPYAARAWHGITGGTRELIATATWDPPSIASGAQASVAVTITGASLGDDAQGTFSLSQGALIDTAYIEGANTGRFILANLTGAPVDLASGTVTMRVFKRRAP
jgi:hypothetical protein